MNDPVRRTAYQKRGEAFEPGSAQRLTTLVCGTCYRSNEHYIMGTVYSTPAGPQVELLRQLNWQLPTGVTKSGVPMLGWIAYELAELGNEVEVICRGCLKGRTIRSAYLRTMLANRPKRLTILTTGVLTL